MDDADRLELTRLFVAAVASELSTRSGPKEPSVPLDVTAFAAAVDGLAAANAIATRFPVFTTVSGRLCPDFQEGMAIAQSAGLISRLNPSFQRFTVNVSGRQIARLSADGRFGDARKLAKEYLALTLGAAESDDRDGQPAVV